MTKARNGEGSIFPVKNKKGKTIGYAVEMSLGFKANGKRNRTRRQVKTYKEALDLRTRMANDFLDGRLTIINAETVSTYGIPWVREVKAQQVRPTTAADYEARLRREVFPMLGTIRMVDLRPAHVDRWMANLRNAGKSANTVNGARQVLGAMCKHANRTGIIPTNPVLATDPVKRQKGEPTQVQEPWTLDEVYVVLDAACDNALDGFLHVMVHLGLRPGEAMGLRWEDVDLGKRKLMVTGTLTDAQVFMPDGQGVVRQVRNDPKTNASRRGLPISDALAESLDRQQMRQAVQEMSAGHRWKHTGYVFTSQVGTPFSLSNLRKKYQKFLQEIDIRYIRLHDIRHTVARIALDSAKIPIEQASQAFGHTRIDTTKQIYAGYVPRYNEEFVAGISQVLPAASRPNPPESGPARVEITSD
jgi:integrase